MFWFSLVLYVLKTLANNDPKWLQVPKLTWQNKERLNQLSTIIPDDHLEKNYNAQKKNQCHAGKNAFCILSKAQV